MHDLIAALVLGATACGGAAPAPAAPASAPIAPDAGELVHTWIVAEHVLVKGASITDADAVGFHGRTIDVTTTGFMSPWQGSCEGATRTERPRARKDVLIELEVPPAERPRVTAFGLGEEVTEFRLTCTDRRNPPPLTLYVGDDKAMTCFGGACYLMRQF